MDLEITIVRRNLMANVNYRPYCGETSNHNCYHPRTEYRPSDSQFICPNCKWVSSFPKDFIDRYKNKHNL